MESLNNSELLNYAIENGMIDIDTIREKIEMNERKKYLEMHESKIWKSTDGKWYTFVPDCTKKDGRKLVKRKTKENIDDYIVAYYKEHEEPQTIEKTYNEWISRKIKFEEISNQTYDRYGVDFRKYFADCMNMKIRYVTTDFLDDFIVDNIRKHGMKAKAWSNLRTLIRGIFLFAKKKGYSNLDISSYLQELDISRKMFDHSRKNEENVVFTKQEIQKIVKELRDSRNIKDMAILVAIYTGMRVGEIVALKWEDIHDDYIHVNRTQINFKDANGKNVHEVRDFPKTEAGIRDVVIVPELRNVLKKMRSINPFTEYVFEKNGEPIHKHLVCSRLYVLCERYGFPKKGMHALRRYYATTLINAGVEEIIVISQMGHTDFSTTKKYYYKDNTEKDYVAKKVSCALNF